MVFSDHQHYLAGGFLETTRPLNLFGRGVLGASAILWAMLLTFCVTQQSKLKVHINILGSVPGVQGGYLIATSHILRDTWQSTIGLQTAFCQRLLCLPK